MEPSFGLPLTVAGLGLGGGVLVVVVVGALDELDEVCGTAGLFVTAGPVAAADDVAAAEPLDGGATVMLLPGVAGALLVDPAELVEREADELDPPELVEAVHAAAVSARAAAAAAVSRRVASLMRSNFRLGNG